MGHDPKEVLGQFVGAFYPSIDEARRVAQAMRDPDQFAPGVVESYQTCFLSASGEEIPVAISGTLLYDEDGVENGTIGYARDLREILHKDQLATLGEVAIGLSHEINNPLAVILNQMEMLEGEVYGLAQEGDCSVEVERIDAIRREVARISEILGRLGEMVQQDSYETINYAGPARMIDLRGREVRSLERDERLNGLRILVVDDDRGICNSLKEILDSRWLRGGDRPRWNRGARMHWEERIRFGALGCRHAQHGWPRSLSQPTRTLPGTAGADDDRLSTTTRTTSSSEAG